MIHLEMCGSMIQVVPLQPRLVKKQGGLCQNFFNRGNSGKIKTCFG